MRINGQSYKHYLRSSPWKAFAKHHKWRIGKCQIPRCVRPPFAVHHLRYDNVDLSNPGNEFPEDLLVLCKECHFLEHPEFHHREKAVERIWHATPYLDKDTCELVPCVRPGFGGDIFNPKPDELTVHFGQPVDYKTAFAKVIKLWDEFACHREAAEAEMDRLFGEPPPGKKRITITMAAHATF